MILKMAENEIVFPGGRLAEFSSLVSGESSFPSVVLVSEQHLATADLTQPNSF